MRKGFYSLLVLSTFLFFGFNANGQGEEESPVALYNQAKEKFDAKEYEAAIEMFAKALEKVDPESDSESAKKVTKFSKYYSAGSHYYVGSKLRKAEKFEEALAEFEKGIAIYEAFPSNFVGKAQALEKLERDTSAVKAYILASAKMRSAKKEETADKLLNRAENFAAKAKSKKNWDTTIACAKLFLAEKETADSYYYLAEGLKGKKKATEALEPINKALELADGDKNKFLFAKAEILEAAGQKAKAIEAYKAVGGDKYAERAKYKATQLGGGK